MKIFTLLFFLMAPLLSLASDLSKLRQQDIKILKVVSSNTEQEKIKPCSEFAKNKKEIISYLSSATEISGEVAHREFDVYHCSVSGSFKIEQQEHTFTIFAGGLGYVNQPNKSEVILGCKNQCCRKSPSICW